jgi:hypothetical protein
MVLAADPMGEWAGEEEDLDLDKEALLAVSGGIATCIAGKVRRGACARGRKAGPACGKARARTGASAVEKAGAALAGRTPSIHGTLAMNSCVSPSSSRVVRAPIGSDVMAPVSPSSPLRQALADAAAVGAGHVPSRGRLLRALAGDAPAALPQPGAGATLARWQALAAVAGHDLGLAKLYEGHADALAILAEAGAAVDGGEGTWGMWAAEAPGARVVFERGAGDACMLSGTKAWCSGARQVDTALLTVWRADGSGPFLARVALAQRGVSFDDSNWQAVGMRASQSIDVRFDRVPARLVGGERFYLDRPGFWQGGIGIAACWHGGAAALGDALRRQVVAAGDKAGWHRLLALGAVDHVLSANAALLREAASWVDAHPRANARTWALRTRAAADAACETVLRHATHALGATPLCRDERFARLAADLPVFVRQCHGDRDLAALGECVASDGATEWLL